MGIKNGVNRFSSVEKATDLKKIRSFGTSEVIIIFLQIGFSCYIEANYANTQGCGLLLKTKVYVLIDQLIVQLVIPLESLWRVKMYPQL